MYDPFGNISAFTDGYPDSKCITIEIMNSTNNHYSYMTIKSLYNFNHIFFKSCCWIFNKRK